MEALNPTGISPTQPDRRAWLLLWAVRGIAAMIFAMTLAVSTYPKGFRFVVLPLALCLGAPLFALRHRLPSMQDRLSQIAPRKWLWTMVFIAFVLRVAWVLFARAQPLSDFALYRDLGVALFEHGQYGYPTPTAYRPIAAPALVALIAWAQMPLPLTFWLFNAAVSAAVAPGVFALASRLGGGEVGKIASLLWVLWPAQIADCALVATEPVCTFLLVWSVVLALKIAENPIWWRAPAVGILLAATTYARSNAILIAPLWFAYNALLGRWQQTLRIGIVVLAMLAALLPWGLRNQATMGEFNLTTLNGGVWLTYGNFDGAIGGYCELPFKIAGNSEVEVNREGYRLAKTWIMRHPLAFVRLIPLKWKEAFAIETAEVTWSTREPHALKFMQPLLLLTQAWYLLLTGLVLLGTWRLRVAALAEDSPTTIAVELHLVLFATWLIVHTFFPGDPRYHAPLLPWYCAFAAFALWPRRADKSLVAPSFRH